MPDFPSEQAVQLACRRAAEAAPILRQASPETIASLLETIADKLAAKESEIVPLAVEESHLPTARLTGELGRTTGQLRMFAKDVRAGAWTDKRTVEALPDRQPLPRPKLERFMIPVGPVAIFGASNFPLAFSVPGGDTASALAAGCPVVAKAHPAHPKLSQLVGDIISEAVKEAGLPVGTFQLEAGDAAVGEALVQDPNIKGVGFTGSQRVGRHLMDLAAARPNPIPVFAEMGSINPVFALPGALTEKAQQWGSGYAQSVLLGVGQFCTNPGVVFGIAGDEWEAFCGEVTTRMMQSIAGPMLTDAIGAAYCANAAVMNEQPGVDAQLEPGEPGQAGLARVSFKDFIANPKLQEEVFGPFCLLVTAESFDELLTLFPQLHGQLTGTILHGPGDEALVKVLAPAIESKVGRIVFNGFPTGVEVCEGMQHGGPYPATSDVRFTSVGNHAILRWLRPISYQNAPDYLK
ncbi:MAG: aldehyde dehydrogenase (NADP(+)) [Armatimonadetes bacterium]|nr:aldehyde dehydrogenase (NADP(+)) [Armatimonadota bacterium]